MREDADEAAQLAVEVAAREIRRLADKQAGANGKGPRPLTGFDGMDLERYQGVCLKYEAHRLGWMQKLEPEKLSDELLRKFVKTTGAEDDGKPEPRRAKRTAS